LNGTEKPLLAPDDDPQQHGHTAEDRDVRDALARADQRVAGREGAQQRHGQ
jgi:hypothetical protein